MIGTISVIAAGLMLVAVDGAAQSAAEVRGAAPVVPLASEAPAKLIVDPPLADSLSHGRVGRRTCTSRRCSDRQRSRFRRASATSTSQSTIYPGTGSTPPASL